MKGANGRDLGWSGCGRVAHVAEGMDLKRSGHRRFQGEMR